MSDSPLVSIVMPTHNRRERLGRTLGALERQEFDPRRLELIVVADGCQDGSAAWLRRQTLPFPLHVLEQEPARGAAVARNLGAARARGGLLLFLDDDIEAAPGLVAAHVRAHEGGRARAVLGALPPVHVGSTLLERHLAAWWTGRFREIEEPGHRYRYDDLFTGNLSIPTSLFAALGGFDPALRCHEDYDLGWRLLQRAVELRFEPAAIGHHHEASTVARSLQRAREEGRADVQLATRHPALRPALPFVRREHYLTGLYRLVRWQASGDRRRADDIATSGVRALRWLERGGRHGLWLRLFQLLRTYWYTRGVYEETQESGRAMAGLLVPPLNDRREDVRLDLDAGLSEAEARLDAERPASVALYYRGRRLGRIPDQPGAERLAGRHLAPYLARHLAKPLLLASLTAGSPREAEQLGGVPGVWR